MSVEDVTHPIRILLVEDNLHDRRVFHRAFRKSDLATEITDCKRAEEALDLLVAGPSQFDLIVSDHGLPGTSGLDLFRQLQERQIERPFVLLTGMGNELLAVEALKLGVDDYLTKNAGQAYIEQLPTSIARVYRTHRDRFEKAQVEAELERREANEKFLSEATATVLLAAMDDYQTTTTKLARLPIPFFADWSIVDLLNQEAAPRYASAAHVDQSRQALVDRLAEMISNMRVGSALAAGVMRSRQPRLINDIINPGRLFGRGTANIAKALQPHSLICTPLVVQKRVLGLLWLAYSDSQRCYNQQDVAFAERIGRRAAIAIENARVYAAVRETDRRKDEFLAMLAHELRNPLAPIRNSLEILQTSSANPTLVEKAITTMERQVEHMMRLVDDLLDLSRAMRGKIRLHQQRVAWDDILERSLELARPLIEARQHELSLGLPAEKIYLDVDEARITQVIANLLNNAAKYTDQGGNIRLMVGVENDELLIRIRDDGIGIEPQLLAEVFGLFRQVESSLNRSHGGLGIGLTLVRSLTEMHGGTVSAYSEGLGKGSEFQVRLPVSQVMAASQIEPADVQQAPAASPAGLQILVVDDNRDAAETLSALLELDGHQVATANEGRVALAMADELRPDVILLDIGMPGINGYEVARQIRRREKFRDTALVAITGFGQEVDRQSARDAGFDHHLVKPVSLQRIRDTLALYSMSDRASSTAGTSSSSSGAPRLAAL